MLKTSGLPNQPAKLIYYSGSFRMVSPGDHVVCAVTGVSIPLGKLRYWSEDRQEPYASAEAATRRMQGA